MGIDKKKFQSKIELAIKAKGDLSKISSSDLKKVAQKLLEEIKDRVASGISPITGKRFEAYKNPKKYPAKKKPQRPVNLNLTGHFLKSLVFLIKTGKVPSITVTFSNDFAKEKEDVHREGANGQPRRPIIPKGNEGFTDGILSAVREVFRLIIDKDLK